MSAKSNLKVAAAQYPIDRLENWPAFEKKITHWLDRASQQRADLVLFPEYFSMELASLFLQTGPLGLAAELSNLQSLLPAFMSLFSSQAQQRRMHIVAGSFPVQLESGEYCNRCHWFFPDGSVQHQDKMVMTRFENEKWHISAGSSLHVFDTDLGKVGVCICYDSEFPMFARKLTEEGVELILVPSCTDSLAGYHRVKIGSQARALENQCYVIQSVTVGKAPWSESVDINNGAAAVFTPVDQDFPPNGILAIGDLNRPGWIYAELEMTKIPHVRSNGQTLNHRDWPRQFDTIA